MKTRIPSALVVLVACSACVTVPLSASELDSVQRPAFVSWIALEAGPRATVFRDDPAFKPRLQGLPPAEADRRLAAKLAGASSRFELSERLRVGVTTRLPAEVPWTHTVPASQVAAALQSFLVEEVPANSPDLRLLEPLGADAVVELVVEAYGMHSRHGRTGVFLRGRGRLFRIDGGELWRRSFDFDTTLDGESMDPLRVAQQPERFRRVLAGLVDEAAAQIAKDLQPAGRRAPTSATLRLDDAPDDTHRAGRPRPPPPPALPPGELPPP